MGLLKDVQVQSCWGQAVSAVLLVLTVSGVCLLPRAAVAAESEPSDLRVERSVGDARDEKGQLVYRESHEVTLKGLVPVRSRTVYSDAAGKTIGTFDSEYPENGYTADYRFEDVRFGRIEQAKKTGNGAVTIFFRETGDDSLQQATRPLTRTMPTTLGQGLHQYTRMNLPDLNAGNKLVVRFGVPAQLDTYEFRIRKIKQVSDTVIRVEMAVGNWFLRLFAPTILADYELATTRLVRYQGLSNLKNANGDGFPTVDIRYTYASSPPPAGSTTKTKP